jgi:hypothetical protein
MAKNWQIKLDTRQNVPNKRKFTEQPKIIRENAPNTPFALTLTHTGPIPRATSGSKQSPGPS